MDDTIASYFEAVRAVNHLIVQLAPLTEDDDADRAGIESDLAFAKERRADALQRIESQ